MKQLTVCVLSLLLAVLPATVRAFGTSAEMTGAPRVRAGRQTQVTLTLSFEDETAGLQGVLSFDDSVLTLVAFEPITEGWVLETGNEGTFILYDDTLSHAFSGSHDAARLTFDVAQEATDGEVTVTLDMEDEHGVNVNVSYVLRVLAADTVLAGDADGNALVNERDRVLLSRFLAEWDLSGRAFLEACADVNGDGEITAIDRAILARYLAGWGMPYDAYFAE